MIDFTDINKNLPNGENMGGIVQKVCFGFHADVDVFPAKPTNPLTIAASATLTGDLTMKAGKRMYELYLTDDTGEFKIEPVGEVDGKSFVQHLSVFHPGLQDKIIGFLNFAKNESLVFIVTDSDGQKYLMSDALRPVVYAGAPDGMGTGKETSSRKGVSMEFTYKTSNLYIYTGNIPLTEVVTP
jgi:hypothetical protein